MHSCGALQSTRIAGNVPQEKSYYQDGFGAIGSAWALSTGYTGIKLPPCHWNRNGTASKFEPSELNCTVPWIVRKISVRSSFKMVFLSRLCTFSTACCKTCIAD